MKAIVQFFLYVWQLPQNLLGLLLVEILTPEENIDYKGVRLHYSSKLRGSISLGRHIIVSTNYRDYNGKTEAHEYGHCRQSKMLGPLYLIVVGLMSLIWAGVYRPGYGKSYYDFYTEKWADRLGGVQR